MAAEEGDVLKETGAAHATSATLIAAICFQMGLFYLTGSSDRDIRKYTYETICQTISIFCAVLMFQAFNDTVETYLLEGTSPLYQVSIDMAHFLCWYAVLQVALAFISGAVDIMNLLTGRPERRPQIHRLESNIYSAGILLAHLTGFASINAWGSLQQYAWFSSGPLHSAAVLPLAVAGQCGLQMLTHRLRLRISLSDDREVDEYEHLWDKVTMESENDVMGLTVSFLIVQSLRFLIGGTLPNAEGKEPNSYLYAHSIAESVTLIGISVLFLLLSSYFVYMEVLHHVPHWLERRIEVLMVTSHMSYAWCFFFGWRWFLTNSPSLQDETLLSVTLAMIMSLMCFACILVLDKIADAEFTDEKVDKVIVEVISWIGTLVGFAWEQCFDDAVVSLSSMGATPGWRHFLRLFLAIFCVVVVVPAWKWWILPMMLKDGWRTGWILEESVEKWLELLGHMIDQVSKHEERAARLPHNDPQRQALHFVCKDSLDRLHQHAEMARANCRRPSNDKVGWLQWLKSPFSGAAASDFERGGSAAKEPLRGEAADIAEDFDQESPPSEKLKLKQMISRVNHAMSIGSRMASAPRKALTAPLLEESPAAPASLLEERVVKSLSGLHLHRVAEDVSDGDQGTPGRSTHDYKAWSAPLMRESPVVSAPLLEESLVESESGLHLTSGGPTSDYLNRIRDLERRLEEEQRAKAQILRDHAVEVLKYEEQIGVMQDHISRFLPPHPEIT